MLLTVIRRVSVRFAADLVVRLDVDPPGRQPRGQPDILPFLADRQGQLVVGHDHLGDPVGLVEYPHLRNPRRGERMADELGWVFRIVDDVDLLAVQFGHHVAYPAAHRADARALGVDARLARDYCDLGTVT